MRPAHLLAIPVAALLSLSCGDGTAPNGPTSLTIEPSDVALLPGSTAQLSATAEFETGTLEATVTWESADPTIATVSPSGLVTGVARGATTISSRIGDLVADASVDVVPDVQGIWDWTEILQSPDLVCNDTGAFRITQTDGAIALVAEQVGACTLEGFTFASGGASDVGIQGTIGVEDILFDWGGCIYTGTVSSAATTIAGTARCPIGFDFLLQQTVFLEGPWQAMTGTPQASIVLAPQTVVEGGTFDLDPEVRAADGQRLLLRPVTLSSNAPAIVDVVGDRTVRTLGIGTATLTATVGALTDDATISVEQIDLVSVTAASGQTCALTVAGVTYCWGDNRSDILGPSPRSPSCQFGCRSAPGAVTRTLTFSSLAVGAYHACGLTGSGTAFCWGSNFDFNQQRFAGILGNDVTGKARTPVPVLGGVSFTSLTAGLGHTCGVGIDGSAYCWGLHTAGQLGVGTMALDYTGMPTMVTGGLTFASITAYFDHTCGTLADGTGYCWGFNRYGQVGTGTSDGGLSENSPNLPMAVVGGLAFPEGLRAGTGHTCGIAADSAAYCWGSNFNDQIGAPPVDTCPGLTPVPCNLQPTRVSNPANGPVQWIAMDAGAGHTCALAADGTAYCWGWNADGQLGDGSKVDRGIPTPVGGGLEFTSISAGDGHSCGIATDGLAYCWGDNDHGQLGDATSEDRLTPVRVVGQS